MLFAGDEKRAKKSHLLTLLPLLAGMQSETAHDFLFGARGLEAEKVYLRLAAIETWLEALRAEAEAEGK